jgi:hypothetical protein
MTTVISTIIIAVFILRIRVATSVAGIPKCKASASSTALEIIIESSVFYLIVGIIWIPLRIGVECFGSQESFGITLAFFSGIIVGHPILLKHFPVE